MKNFRTEGAPRRGGFGANDRGDRGGFGGGDRGRGGFGGGNRGRGGFGGRDSSAPRIMHKATCAECNKICEVPFKPTGEKPVFCSDCFSQRGDRMEERNNRPSRFSTDRQALAERPSQPAKVDNSRLEDKLETISAKLDKLFDLLSDGSLKEVKALKEIKEVKEIAVAPKKVVAEKVVAEKKAVSKKIVAKKDVKVAPKKDLKSIPKKVAKKK